MSHTRHLVHPEHGKRDTWEVRKAIEIRIRAERHGGKLMAAMQRSDRTENLKQGPTRSAGGSEKSVYRRSIEKAGIPERTAQRWQELRSYNLSLPDVLSSFSYREKIGAVVAFDDVCFPRFN